MSTHPTTDPSGSPKTAPVRHQGSSAIFASNEASIALFGTMGFERWGFMPAVARLDGVEKDRVLVGKRLHEPRAA